MAKQLNQVQVNLQFTADTKQAKQQLEGLQQTLNNLVRNPSGNLDKQMAAAAKSAAELSSHLAKATNRTTGTLDFSKLNQSIQKSGKSISEYGAELLKLGPAGHQAFSQLTTAITNSEIPMRRMSKTLQEMGTVLSNTIRWQISSSAIHAMQGAIQGAYRYAQNLNKSLNDIRIVTGQSAEQMEKFAERANRAAKNLSSTTLDYTNASLIYYQQGLSDEEVEARTNVTIKMANAAGESAEKVSSQLTAVWNNFAKGGENLEYYADVMTALGAATASSTDEISQGLEKFASVADTVGLSYEYAAAALATVTATTRQSADVVGNAFKTLFARLEGLKLGETLDDGTDLNKYSQALSAVGVSIKDTDGELRNMDNILDDLAGKWQNLSKDQKMALAQTVAGVRQYTQLIALMDNWDFMERNIETARKSSGTLQRQADIYAESWEAAQKRVQTALQGVYNALIKDDFFITILNGTEKVITGVNNVIKAFGGLPGVLSTLGVVFTRVFEKQIAQGLQNTVYNIKMMLPGGKAELVQTREAELTKLADLTATQNYDTDQDLKRAQALDTQINLHKELIQNASKLNEIEFSTTLQLLDQVDAQRQNLDAVLKEQEIAQASFERYLDPTYSVNRNGRSVQLTDNDRAELRALATEYEALNELTRLSEQTDLSKAESQQKLNDIANKYGLTLNNQNSSIRSVIGTLQTEIRDQESVLLLTTDNTQAERDRIVVLTQSVHALHDVANKNNRAAIAVNNVSVAAKKASEAMTKQRLLAQSWADNMVFAAQSLSQLSMGFNSLKGVLNSLNDDNLSFFEKLSSIIPALSFGLPQLINGFLGAGSTLKSIGLKFPELIKQYHSLTAVQKTKQVLDKVDIDLSEAKRLRQNANISLLGRENKRNIQNILTKQLDLSTTEQQIVKTELDTLAKKKNNQATEEEIQAIVKKIMAQRAENAEETASIGLKQKIIALNQVFHLQYIALAIAIAAVVFIIHKLIQARKADAEQAERAAQLASSLKENYENAKTAAEELRKTISDYKDGIKSLNQLDKATDEYKETLKKTNEEARKLIETVGAYGDWHYDSNGAIIVDNLDKYQQQADQRVTSIQQSYQAAQIESVKANLAAQATSTVRGLGLNTGDLNREQDLSSIVKIYQDWKSEPANGNANNLDLIKNINEYLESQGKAAFAVDESVFERIESKLSNFTEAIDNANSKIRYFSQELEKTKIEENFGDRIKESLLSSDNEVYASVMNVLANELITENETADWSNYKGIDSLTSEQLNFFGLSMPSVAIGKKPTEEYLRAYIENVLKQDLSGYTYKDGKFIDIAGNELSGVNTDNLDMKMIIQGLAYAYDQMTNKTEYTEKNKQTVNDELSFTNRLIENFGSDYAKLINNFRASPNESLSGLSSFNHYSEYTDAQKFIDDFIAGKDDWQRAGFENADIFIEAFQKELSNVDWKAFNTTKNNEGIEAAKALGLDEKEFVIYRNLLQEQSEILQGLSDEDYAKYVEGVNAASIANKRLERGVTDICKKWKDYDAIMKDSNAAIEDVSRVLADVNPAVQDMLNLSNNEFALLPPDFAKKHWDIINDVTEGVEGAADRLRDIAGEEILLKIAGDDTALQSKFSEIQAEIASFDGKGFKIGVALNREDEEEVYAAFNRLLEAGQLTAAEMQAYAKSMGYDVQIDPRYDEREIEIPVAKYTAESLSSILAAESESTGSLYDVTFSSKKATIRTPIIPSPVRVITPNGSYGGNHFVKTDGIKGNKNTGSSGGGKGGSSSKKETKTVERYKTVTDQIDKIKDSYSDVNKEADRLFGPKRWAEIEKSNKLLEKQNDLLEEKKKEAEDYFDQDQAALMGAAAAAGITFEFDADGIISNYREQMEAYYARYNSSEQTDEQKEILKKLEEALKQYEDTRKVLQDIQNEIDDNTRAIQDANNKILTERFNLKVEIRADQLKYIENQIKALGDDFFKRNEIFMLMANKLASYDGSNMTIDRSWYDQLIGQFNDIQNANISDADWLNNMKTLKNEAQSAFDALIDWSKGMSTYYAETLSEFASGLDFFTKQLDHLNETIDHYRKTASLVGRDKDFQLLAKISEATLHNAIQQKEVKEAELALLERQKDTVLNTYNGPWSSEEDRNAYFQAAVKPILEQYQTVEKEVQALDEKILEANNQWAENKKNQALEIAEMALTAGKGFDQLNKSMDLASKTQDLLLTKTNQYYEIDKLINDINKDIDKTDNLAAKQRYKNLADEISGLREKNQLSQFELKVAQAKYAQLQAQIALEEVQNAKSTVRLQRDNEGNYGYVYTADISQIEDAEQELRDKTNDLYNLYLEGANTTAQELLKLQQEFQDDLANIDWTAADAMQQAMELRKRYLEEVEILLSDHNIATTGLAELGAQGIQEAWTTEFFDPNIESLENWKDITDQEIEEITQVYQDWEDVIKDNTDVLDSLDNIDKELEVVKEEAERLNEQGQDYIDKSESIIGAIQNETDAWAKQYTQIQNLVQEYLNLAKAIDDTIDAKRREAIEEAKRQQEEAKQITPVAPVITNTTNTNSNNSNNTGNNGSNGVYGGSKEGQTITDINGYTWKETSAGSGKYKIQSYHIAPEYGYNNLIMTLEQIKKIIREIEGSYDTGGYTGSWGSDGRLAMLHEKELVLNKEDTKNFLAGVEILRSITGAIDLQAAAAGTATPISTPGFNLGGQTLQQSVTISAEFPNATNHSEIEEAFNNLINRASQYAHRQSFYNQV